MVERTANAGDIGENDRNVTLKCCWTYRKCHRAHHNKSTGQLHPSPPPLKMTEREKSEHGNKPKIASIDAKIVLLGDTGVGKTSLALRFVQDAFSSRTAPTVGASFLTKVL
jgi:polynucleotide 5'-kinase involved in rRNA processing